jgi:hypothetical protein
MAAVDMPATLPYFLSSIQSLPSVRTKVYIIAVLPYGKNVPHLGNIIGSSAPPFDNTTTSLT